MAPELRPTKLGKKEYWDEVYNQEIDNFEQGGDEGEIWFGEETVEKMVSNFRAKYAVGVEPKSPKLEWTLENSPPGGSPYVLDIGTGNGIMTVTLAENGYDANRLVGIDYSEPSIRLAKAVAAGRGHPSIRYLASDFINEPVPALIEGKEDREWDLLLDKGTYDAIALAEKPEDGASLVSKYPSKVSEALKPGGMFLITSCNFTEEELKEAFIAPELGLSYHSRVQHPVYTYGGKSGSAWSTVAFKKN